MPHTLHWNPAESVGSARLDQDHRTLLDIANQIITACAGTEQRDVVMGLLDDLVTEALAHFEAEETLLRDTDFPGWEHHREAHNRLLRVFLTFKADYRFGRLDGEQVVDFIVDWLLNHMKEEDLAFKPHLEAHHAP